MKSTQAKSYRVMLTILSLLVIASAGKAQQKSKTLTQSSSKAASERQAGNNFHSSFASSEFASNGRVAVQGAPFSAVGIKETTQILSDGSPLVRRMTASLYRDSAGRTRIEWGNSTKTEATAGVPMLFDAVNGATYFLEPQRQVAVQLSSSNKGIALRQPTIITPQSPPDNITQVVGETIEPLGTKTIEGVMAEGVRVTSTIPATGVGSKSNKVVYERWYSQELRVNVLIKCIDPRFGEAVYRLTNIDRSEPARELFEIPAAYKIRTLVMDKPARALKSSYVK